MAKWVAIVVAVLIVAAALWGAGELHYRNCVNTAVAQHAIGDNPALDPAVERRQRAIRQCNRVPW